MVVNDNESNSSNGSIEHQLNKLSINDFKKVDAYDCEACLVPRTELSNSDRAELLKKDFQISFWGSQRYLITKLEVDSDSK